MRRDDLLFTDLSDPMGGSTLREDLVGELMKGPLPNHTDLDVAPVLADLVHDSLIAYGTGGLGPGDLNGHEIRTALSGLKAVLTRLGIPHDIPWRDYGTFEAFWRRQGAAGTGGWAKRRHILAEVFDPISLELDRLADASLQSVLAEGVSPQRCTGWQVVDTEILEMRRGFRSASTPQDYRNVGNHAVAVLEALADAVYDPQVHSPGQAHLPKGRTKDRIGAFVRERAPGGDNKELRSLVNSAIEFAQSVKHAPSSRREAGVAADSAILLANLLRRIAEDE